MTVRPALRAFALGAVAAAILLHALLVGGLLVVREDVRVALGPVLVVMRERDAAGTATTLGPGVLLLVTLGGALNAGVAALLQRRRS